MLPNLGGADDRSFQHGGGKNDLGYIPECSAGAHSTHNVNTRLAVTCVHIYYLRIVKNTDQFTITGDGVSSNVGVIKR
jgi:hypothetical protein